MAMAAIWSYPCSLATSRLRPRVSGAWSGSENHWAEPTAFSARESCSCSPKRSASSMARPPASIAPGISRASIRMEARWV